MKKKIFGGLVVAAVAAIASFNVNINLNAENEISSVSLANVEALAQSESGGNKKCWNTITTKEGSQVLYCQSCSWVSGTYSWSSSSGTC